VVAIPGYEVLGELGRGGMGVVYRARQTRLNRLVALKMILAGSHAGEQDRRRFLREAEAVARLQHPNIVQIHEVGEADGHPFFSLELCPGGNLAGKLQGKPLPAREAARLVETLAWAVQAAHEAGLVHRDLKPANVLLAADGTPKITDFGLAKKLDGGAGLTASGAILGTPSYMAPEQAGNRTKAVGPAADVYALGAILYECLTGRPPFQAADALDTVLRVVSEEPAPPRRLNPACPRDLETVCLKCLRKEPAQRYASARALAEDLQRFGRGEPVAAHPPSLLYVSRSFIRRHRVAALVAAALLGVLGLGTSIGVLYQQEKQRTRQLEELLSRREPDPQPVASAKAAGPVKAEEPPAPVVRPAVADGERIYKNLLKSTALIMVPMRGPNGAIGLALGSGALVDTTNRLVITNYHVVGTSDQVFVFFPTHDNWPFADFSSRN
jgi:serine/threonine-protein kinase